jgi:hypothetical protein
MKTPSEKRFLRSPADAIIVLGAHAHSRFFIIAALFAFLLRVHCHVPTIATSASGRGALPSRSKRPRAGGTDQAGATHRPGLLGSSQRGRDRI